MNESTRDQAGGIYIGGNVGGDVTGRDKMTFLTNSRFMRAMSPIADAIGSSPVEIRPAAEEMFASLQQEVSKANGANDGKMAKLIDGLIGMVPRAAGAVATAFSAPIISEFTGPATQYVLTKLRGDG